MNETRIGVAVSASDSNAALSVIEDLEKRGIRAAWMTSGSAGGADSLGLFAAAATRTQQITLGTAITQTFSRHPVAMAFVATVLVSVSTPVMMTLIMHLAGQSRGTAGGMLSTSNQFGSFVGASAGGLMLSLGGYTAVGLLCLVATVLSASVVGLIMRRSPAFQLGGAELIVT